MCTIHWLKGGVYTLFSCRTWQTHWWTNAAVRSWLACRAVRLPIFTDITSWAWHRSITIWAFPTSFTSVTSDLQCLVCVLSFWTTLRGRHSWRRATMTCRTSLACCGPDGCKLSFRTHGWWCAIWTLIPLRAYCTCRIAHCAIKTFCTCCGFWSKVLTLETFWTYGTLCLSCIVAIVTRLTRFRWLTFIRARKSCRTFLMKQKGCQ